jgi:hypothetical protein
LKILNTEHNEKHSIAPLCNVRVHNQNLSTLSSFSSLSSSLSIQFVSFFKKTFYAHLISGGGIGMERSIIIPAVAAAASLPSSLT